MKLLTNFPYSPFGRSAGSTQRFLQIILTLRELGHEIRLWSFTHPSGYQWESSDLERAQKLGIEIILIERGKFESSILNGVDAIWGIYFHYMKFYEEFHGPKIIDAHDILTPNFKIDKHFGHFLSKDGDIFAFDRAIFDKPISCTEFPIDEEELEVYRKYHPIMISLREQEKLAQKGIRSTYIPYIPKLPPKTSDYSGLPLTLCSAHLNNLYANDFLGTTLLPKIRLSAHNFEINSLGEIDTICRHFPAINYLGYREDDLVLRTARFGIWNSKFGTGAQIKLYTYAAYGLPIVCFRERAEPFMVHGTNSLIADSQEEFIAYCVFLWKDVELCHQLGQNARESVESFYTKDRLLNDLNTVVQEHLCK